MPFMGPFAPWTSRVIAVATLGVEGGVAACVNESLVLEFRVSVGDAAVVVLKSYRA